MDERTPPMNPFTLIELGLGTDQQLRTEALALAAARARRTPRPRRVRAVLRRVVGLRATTA